MISVLDAGFDEAYDRLGGALSRWQIVYVHHVIIKYLIFIILKSKRGRVFAKLHICMKKKAMTFFQTSLGEQRDEMLKPPLS